MGTSDPNIGVGYKVAGASLFVVRKLFAKFDFWTLAFAPLGVIRDHHENGTIPDHRTRRQCLDRASYLKSASALFKAAISLSLSLELYLSLLGYP